jgi:uncharacterized protein YcnI
MRTHLSTPLSRRFSSAARVATATAVLGAAAVLLAGPADAHVTVGADDNQQGTPDTVLSFRVPNENEKATTVKVQISFPVKDPIASVKPAPKPGWTITTKTVTFPTPITTDDGTLTSGIGQVTWTATAAAQGTPAGSFDAFDVLVGPLPQKATSLAFPTVQTYSDGSSVGWVEPEATSGDEPEHPVPVLALASASGAVTEPEAAPSVAAAAAASADAAGPSVEASAAAAPVAAAPVAAAGDYATKSDAASGRTLGLVGLVLGALGLVAGGAAFVRSGRRSGSTTV